MGMNDLFTSLIENIWNPPDIIRYASRYDDNSLTGSADEYDWELIPEFPLSTFIGTPGTVVANQTPEDWANWYYEEVEMMKQDMGIDLWGDLFYENITDPIVISIKDGEWDLWDGWHRTAASIASGRKTIPAVLGKLKENVNEGMDSAFFLSKDLNYSAEYPLPHDSVHHKNINTHSQHNKKVLKNVTQRAKSKAERKEITKKEKTSTTK